jgi:hypothetical protein
MASNSLVVGRRNSVQSALSCPRSAGSGRVPSGATLSARFSRDSPRGPRGRVANAGFRQPLISTATICAVDRGPLCSERFAR